MRLIDVDELRNKFINWLPKDGEVWESKIHPVENISVSAVMEIDEAPTIEAVPVMHGEWIPYFEDVEIYNSGGFTQRKQTGWICGKCKSARSFVSSHKKYCSECGARMDGAK